MTRGHIEATSLALAMLAIGVALGYAVGRDHSSTPVIVAPATVTKTVARKSASPRARTEKRARTDKRVRTGGRVFVAARCGRCHTLGRRSDTKVNLADLNPTYDVIVEAVTKGGIRMPAYKNRLSPREIRNVAAFVERQIE